MAVPDVSADAHLADHCEGRCLALAPHRDPLCIPRPVRHLRERFGAPHWCYRFFRLHPPGSGQNLQEHAQGNYRDRVNVGPMEPDCNYALSAQLLHRAAASEAATLEQAKEWQSVRILLTIDKALASPDGISSQILAPELVFTIIAFLGVSDDQARSDLGYLIRSLDRHLRSSPPEDAAQPELQLLAQDVIRASQDLSEILQVDAAEAGQDSKRLQAVEAIDSASKALVAMLSNAEATPGEHLPNRATFTKHAY